MRVELRLFFKVRIRVPFRPDSLIIRNKEQVLANKDASPFLCCFVVVVVGHGCYGGCGLRHCCGGYLDACELLLSLLLIFFIGKD